MIAVLIEVIGWVGAVLVLGAYILVSMGRLSGTSATFQWMNAVGAALVILNSWWHGAIPSMVLNIVRSVIGFAAPYRLARRSGGSGPN